MLRQLVSRLIRATRAALTGGWSAVRDIAPDFWRNLRNEFAAGQRWFNRAIVLSHAALTGAVVVGFTLLAEGKRLAIAS